ncbi:unnamed protein product [Penicillium roqueforti FM164]|uniref:Uncharacterized protein n=1 Tax=Penicillium roqueforti (strain FM164) TaxID=1365484 RepID=W6QL33_PENRF|nr:unnamed protein product [Penicillium roqueforti FM164]
MHGRPFRPNMAQMGSGEVLTLDNFYPICTREIFSIYLF